MNESRRFETNIDGAPGGGCTDSCALESAISPNKDIDITSQLRETMWPDPEYRRFATSGDFCATSGGLSTVDCPRKTHTIISVSA